MAHELCSVNGRTAMMYVGEVPWHGLGSQLGRPRHRPGDHRRRGPGLRGRPGRPDHHGRHPRPPEAGRRPDRHQRRPRRRRRQLRPGPEPPGLRLPRRRGRRRRPPLPHRRCPPEGRADLAARQAARPDPGPLLRGRLREVPPALQQPRRIVGPPRPLHQHPRGLRQHALAWPTARDAARGSPSAIRATWPSKVREARNVLGLARRYFDDLEGQIDLLARHYPTYAQVSAYFKALVPRPGRGEQIAGPRTSGTNSSGCSSRGKGQDIPEIKLTTWAALNAVTEYVDHLRPTRAKTEFDRAANRLESAWFGTGSLLKQKAFQLGPGDGREQLSRPHTPRRSPLARRAIGVRRRRAGYVVRRGRPRATRTPRTHPCSEANVGLSRKLSKDYQSTGFSLNLEGEINATLDDPEAVIERIRELYDLADEALRRQVEAHEGDSAIASRDAEPPPRHGSNGHPDGLPVLESNRHPSRNGHRDEKAPDREPATQQAGGLPPDPRQAAEAVRARGWKPSSRRPSAAAARPTT